MCATNMSFTQLPTVKGTQLNMMTQLKFHQETKKAVKGKLFFSARIFLSSAEQ